MPSAYGVAGEQGHYFKTLKMALEQIGSTGYYAGSGSAEIPINVNESSSETGSAANMTWTQTRSVEGSVRVEIEVSGYIGKDGTGSCTIKGSLTHDEEELGVRTQEFDHL